MVMSSEGRRFSIDAAVAIPAEPPPMMTTSWFSLWAMTNSPIYFSLLAEPLAQAGQIVTGPPSASDALIGGCILDVGERIERDGPCRSEEHTSELQSLMRISYAVFCLKKKKHNQNTSVTEITNKTVLRI